MRLRAGGQGPLVIKVAGLVGGVGIFDEAMRSVRRAGFRVAALDTTGDRADDPAAAPLTWNGLADEVARAVEQLGAPRAVLWGTSFGALVCLAAAARHPRSVAGLVLAFPPEPGRLPRPYRALLGLAGRSSARANAMLFHGLFMPLVGWEAVWPRAAVRLPALLRAARGAATPASTVRDKLWLLIDDPAPFPDLPIPATIIAGSLDTVTPVSGARRLAGRLPESRLRVLRCAGHGGTFSRPATYTSWVVEELRRLTRSGSGPAGRGA